jgi:hypothetical protein
MVLYIFDFLIKYRNFWKGVLFLDTKNHSFRTCSVKVAMEEISTFVLLISQGVIITDM